MARIFNLDQKTLSRVSGTTDHAPRATQMLNYNISTQVQQAFQMLNQ